MMDIINGYYYYLNKSENTLDIFKFFPDGKVINDVITIDDISDFTDHNKRDIFFNNLEKHFNYNYKGGFGYIESNNGNIYFNITYYKNGIYDGEVEHIGLIKKNSLDLVVISHRTEYREKLIYNFK